MYLLCAGLVRSLTLQLGHHLTTVDDDVDVDVVTVAAAAARAAVVVAATTSVVEDLNVVCCIL